MPGIGEGMNATEDRYEHAVRVRNPELLLRAETPGDADFLSALFMASSPLAGLLPEPILRQQALAQQIGHRTDFPHAMRRIVALGGADIGHVVIDWSDRESCYCVDIAILPGAQRGGIGGQLLEAWTEVADRLNRSCSLQVMTDNPARRIYERMGFMPQAGTDPHSPLVELARPIRQRPA